LVKLTKIYTRTGDAGTTRLGDMSQTVKHDPRVEAYGDVDETNSSIGLVRATLDTSDTLSVMLGRIQNDLFDVGADLCVPISGTPPEHEELRVTDGQVMRLENEIDDLNSRLKPLNSFILPGGNENAARLHMSRTICRRAERKVSALMEGGAILNPAVLKYLNRLSDLLFVMARIANNNGQDDVLWVPGGER